MPSTNLRILQEVLTDTQRTASTCDKIAATELLAYVEAALAGQDPAVIYPHLHQILESSPVCQQEYREVYELLRCEQQGEWQEPPPTMPVDLSYLDSLEPALWSVDPSGRLFIFISPQRLQRARSPEPQEGYRRLRGETDCTILLAEKISSGKDLNIALTVQAASQEAEHCTLVINADIPSRQGWPHLADTLIILKQNQIAPQEQYTDEFGNAVFVGYPVHELAGLTIVVEPQKM